MREAKALKEYFKIKELFIVIGIVMCIPYIPLTQKIEKNLLLLGFPYKFLFYPYKYSTNYIYSFFNRQFSFKYYNYIYVLYIVFKMLPQNIQEV